MSASAVPSTPTSTRRSVVDRPPVPETAVPLAESLTAHISRLEGSKNLILAVDSAVGRKNAVDKCLQTTVSFPQFSITVANALSQTIIIDILQQMKNTSDDSGTVPDGNLLLSWLLSLRDLPAGTPGLKRLRAAFQQISADLFLFSSVTDDEGSEDSESDANPDLPQDEAEEPANSPAAIPDEVPSVDDSSADKGKERAASPTPDTDREVAKTMKLIDSAMQKDLAGRQVLQQQNLELQEPPVSTPLFLSPLPMLISFLGSSATDALN